MEELIMMASDMPMLCLSRYRRVTQCAASKLKMVTLIIVSS